MSKYICDICRKDFKVKSHYDEHKYNRKKPCKLTVINSQNVINNDGNSQNSQKNTKSVKLIKSYEFRRSATKNCFMKI